MTHDDRPRVQSLEVSEDQLARLLEPSDDGAPVERERRTNERYTFQYQRRVLAVFDYTDKERFRGFSVKPNELSETGMSFLLGAFVCPGTNVLVVLTSVDGQKHKVAGMAVRCRQVDRGVHEVGVRFNEQLNASTFVADLDETAPDCDEGREAA